ncbi:MAG TPA: BTAD domain-containing putative transcriptional regulator [Acidimicrobiales bacterium]|nr:BTAD domain-containing putative transcriptional regulator [Acidimicrobiales bacterium]
MDIRLLGPVQLVGPGGIPVGIGGPKERAALAVLALHANQAVSEDRLIDALWGDDPPRTAARTLQSHVSRLRRAFHEDAADAFVLDGQAGGWVLRTGPEAVDVMRFEALLAKGRQAVAAGDHLSAALAFGDALRLWRGRALDEFADEPWAAGDAVRLEELRLLALEERIEAELACGRHHEVVGDLEAACRSHPLRERLWGQRMIALYRAGRQADALRAFQELRRTLSEELGIDPNPALARLENAILTQSPTLDWLVPESSRVVAPHPIVVTPTVEQASLAGGVVTLLFTDIVSSTALMSRLGDELFEEIRRAHFHMLREAVTEAGGSEVKNLGDGLMAVFPSAVDALSCAVAIQQAVARHNARSVDRQFAVRVGLHIGEPIREEADFFGMSVVIAKRLCDRAGGGEILASKLVADLVGSRGGFLFDDLGLLSLKGISDDIAACTVGWAQDIRRPLPAALVALQESSFVGRDAELVQLQAAFARARGGAREVVLIAGEPGIGKTTLAVQLAAAAGEQGAIALFGRCDEESLVPFQPFVEAVAHYLESTPVEELRRQLGGMGADLALLVPTIARRLPELAGIQRSGAETERFRLFEAVSDLFDAIGIDAPIVLVLDDLHWADRPTLQLLTHVIRKVTSAPLLIVGTYRDTDLVRTHPMAETLVELRRANLVERVPLRGLSRDDVIAMVTGSAPTSPPDVALGGALWHETEGSPLFLREILRHLAETGSVVRSDDGRWVATRRIEQLGIPEGVKEVIGRRLTRLSEDANTALRAGSVLGREFRLEVLEKVTDLGTDALLDSLDEATAAGVVEEVPGAVGRWTFTHALVREALYDELSLTRRVRFHQRVGEAIEALHPDDDGPHLAELAFHFAQAAVAAGPDKAIDYGRRAGEHALRLAGYEEAARHYAVALEVAEDAGLDRRVRADLLLSQGDAETRIGDPRPPRATFERAVALIASDDADRLARVAIGYVGARVRVWWAQIAVLDERAVELLEVALAALPVEDSVHRAVLLAALAQELHWAAGSEQRRIDLSAEAVAMARRIGDPGTLAYVLCARNFAAAAPERAHEWVANAVESLRAAGEVGDRQLEALARTHLYFGYLQLDDLDHAVPAVDAASDAFSALKDPAGSLAIPSVRGNLAMLEGRFADAEAMFLESFLVGQQARDPNTFMFFAVSMFVLRHFQGRLIEFLGMIDEGMALFPAVDGMSKSFVSGAFAELEMAGQAAETLEQVDPSDPASLPRDIFLVVGLHFLARACFLLRDEKKAATIYEMLEPYGDLNALIGWIPLGSVQRALAWCAAACARYDDAVRHFEEALRRHRTNGWMALVAETQRDYARTLARRGAPGDSSRALQMLDELTPVATELGMPGLVAQAVQLRGELTGQADAAPVRGRTVTRRARARARLTSLGRAAVSAWTGGRSDEDLARRFSAPLAQRTLFATMGRAFQPAMAFGFEGDITLDLRPVDDDGDPDAADWWTIEVRGTKASARPGRSEHPAVVIHTGLANFLRVAAGEVHPLRVLIDNAVEVEGDIMLAARLPDMFGAVEPLEVGGRAK